MSKANEDVVTRLCLGLRGPLAEWTALLAEDVDYLNVPIGAVKGREAAARFLEPFVGDGHNTLVDAVIVHTTSSGNVVMNERTETWVKGDVRVVLPVAGVFEVENGKIRKWRDYFDLATVQPYLDAVTKGSR